MSPTLKKIDEFRRGELEKLILQCTEPQQKLFRQMYAYGNLQISISQVVDQMPSEKIDWAIQQCERTLAKARNQPPSMDNQNTKAMSDCSKHKREVAGIEAVEFRKDLHMRIAELKLMGEHTAYEYLTQFLSTYPQPSTNTDK